jgi:hypothetical protein
LVSALLTLGAFVLVSYCTRWIPQPVNEMLSLMTPVMLMLFAVQQLRYLSPARRGLVLENL